MTDGILLRELSADLLLSQYSVIVLDEAHERGLNTDILLGILSRVVTLRAAPPAAAGDDARRSHPGPLKLIVMSATLQVESLRDNSRLWKTPPPVINVDARQHPVTCHFSRVTADDHMMPRSRRCAASTPSCRLGNSRLFDGQREIEEMCAELRKKFGRWRARRRLRRRRGRRWRTTRRRREGAWGCCWVRRRRRRRARVAGAFAGFGDSDDDDDDDYDEEEEEEEEEEGRGRGRRRGQRRGRAAARPAAAAAGRRRRRRRPCARPPLYSMLRASEQRRVRRRARGHPPDRRRDERR